MRNNSLGLTADAAAYLEAIRSLGVWPNVVTLNHCSTDRTVKIAGEEFLFFSSNNYLGLANHPEIVTTLKEGVDLYGFGSGASRIIGGTFDAHLRLENEVAKFKNTEAAIIFSTGSIANDTVINALANIPKFTLSEISKKRIGKIFGIFETAIFSDELNHASIIDGVRSSGAKKYIFRHRDYNDLEQQLRRSKERKKIIISDSVFSMDGDMVDISRLVDLKKKYSALLYIDEAHSVGVFGETGAGITEKYNTDEIDVKMGTFSKALGGAGGYVASSKLLIDYLRFSCRKYIFSTSMPPATAHALIKSIEIVKKRNDLREKLKENISHLRELLTAAKFDYLDSHSQIIPIIIGDEKKTMEFSQELFRRHIYVPGVIWPATAKKMGRLRVSLIASHTKKDIETLCRVLLEIRSSWEK